MSHSILVIDDNELNLKLAEKILTLSGYQVLVANRGEQGIDVALAHRPDLILLDIRLPDIDGLEVLRRLRSFPETRKISVLAMTAQAMPEEVDRFVAAGCDGYVQKPISITSFRAEVQRHLTAATGGSHQP